MAVSVPKALRCGGDSEMENDMMKVTRDHITCAHSAQDKPAAYVSSGDCVELETYDCYKCCLLPEGTTFDDLEPGCANPATGPVFVNGAMPGDVLRIEIRKIELGPVGILDVGPSSGALAEFFPDRRVIKRIPVKDGVIHYSDAVKLPAKPMIGVIGVAPAGVPVKTITPMDHGGNMDCTKIEEGAVLYLPVFAEGALLSAGDFHAVMGEGEVANCGLEIEGRVQLKLDVLKDFPIKWPVIENEEQWITVAYGETLDEAADKAAKLMFSFLTDCQGLSDVDASMLLHMAGDMIVCQIVNPLKTVRMEVPKQLIGQMKA